MDSICVYCGSANQASQKYFQAARRMGETLVRRGLTLVYGGGKTGLMGALADSVVDGGGKAIGVIVETMNTHKLAHTHLTRMEVTPTIHQRKKRMYELAIDPEIASSMRDLRKPRDENLCSMCAELCALRE